MTSRGNFLLNICIIFLISFHSFLFFLCFLIFFLQFDFIICFLFFFFFFLTCPTNQPTNTGSRTNFKMFRCTTLSLFIRRQFDEGEMGILSGMNPIPILSAAFNSTAPLHRPAPLNGEQTKGLAKNSQAGSPSHFGFCPKCVNDCIGGAHIRCKSSIFLKRILETILLSQSI